jgi:hypothetical protein
MRSDASSSKALNRSRQPEYLRRVTTASEFQILTRRDGHCSRRVKEVRDYFTDYCTVHLSSARRNSRDIAAHCGNGLTAYSVARLISIA